MKISKSKVPPVAFILDVDGVMTNGQFLYSADGKVMKIFGADDNDALSLLKGHMEIRFVTGDKKGFSISKKRIVDDMQYPLDIVSTIRRLEWIADRYTLDSIVYMGDGIFDHYVMSHVFYAIAPQNADRNAKAHADFVTQRAGGDRAVAEAVLHILEKFFSPFDPGKLPIIDKKISGEWSV